jgi:putative ABC transport system substrate-binding protein
MKRREFIVLLGGAAISWPHIGHTQPAEKTRTPLGVLMNLAADDPEAKARIAAFLRGLQELGWTDGRNLRITYCWSGTDADHVRKSAGELVALAPDIILAQTSMATAALLEASHTVPIVFTIVADPVGAGYVNSLAHPGGNATGFSNYEYSLAGKWPELLKRIAPGVTQVVVLRDASVAAGPGQFAAIQSVAGSLGMELRPVNVRDSGEIERAIATFATGSNGGLIVTGSPQASVNRALIIGLAARYRLPAIYNERFFVNDGGLISYGSNNVDQFRRAAAYVDRVLKGEKPADLPVQAPTRYDLAINLKTAKALGLNVPPPLLASADAVIE